MDAGGNSNWPLAGERNGRNGAIVVVNRDLGGASTLPPGSPTMTLPPEWPREEFSGDPTSAPALPWVFAGKRTSGIAPSPFAAVMGNSTRRLVPAPRGLSRKIR